MESIKYLSKLTMNPKFIDFTKEELQKFLSSCKIEKFNKGDMIIKEGEKGDKLYIVVEGQVGVSKAITEEVVFFLTTLSEGDFFGEMAILTSHPRSANVFAKTDTTLLSFDITAYDTLKREDKLLFAKLNSVFAVTLAERLYKVEERIKLIIKASLIKDII
ncbi:cyclic nucleotide-binding domain-containing protein [Deferribacter autotrophicus]|uniref:Cyclic nucleotide-binding domain-containing protein n=1 Tax=Deferribacter autotrophicus TaxID=500465 RepID=A0A5A8F3U8_9BACT|nr:cyclic nucleotide-binding domain-containing protein [Deferribacter autotrophicus]KAA0258548.1 cyclic nucleotide-binding domain-containing protein [Deferribacter autotrophicus]